MKRMHRHPLTLTGLLVIAALCLGLMPRTTSAVRLTLTLADDNASFGTGRFFRTGLTSDQPAGPGGVQLVPTKLQPSWQTTDGLPIKLASHTSAVYRDRIFVVGGKTLSGAQVVDKTNVFFSTKLADPVLGSLRPWADQPALPPLPDAVSDAASTVVTVGGQPFLFVMGGQRKFGSSLDDVTSDRIFYYPIAEDANGYLVVTTWREITGVGQKLPMGTNYGTGDFSARGGGARGLGIASVDVGGTPYIYLFGGFNRVFFTGNGYTTTILDEVWRTSITGADNSLTLNWGAGAFATMPLEGTPPAPVRLESMASVTFNSPDPAIGDTGVYLIGGTRCTALCESTTPTVQSDEKAYTARIDTNGALTWLPDGNMSESRTAHDAIQANGQVLVVAGRAANDSPSITAAKGFIGAFVEGRPRTVDDDLTLYRDPTTPSAPNFDLVSGFLGNAQARMNHTMETLKGTADNQFAYIIGGQIELQPGVVQEATEQVWLGNLKTPPVDTDNVVSDGKYYTKVYDFGPNATFYSLFPKTIYKRDAGGALIAGQSVQIQYRIGDSEQSLGAWSTPVTADDGRTQLPMPPATTGHFIQFQVSLYRAAGDLQAAPILDKLELDVNRNGFPNIQVAAQNGFSIGPVTLTDPISARVTITNQAFSPAVPALNANWDAEGSFFVIMYRLGPGQDKPRPDWPNYGDSGIAFTEVGKSSLPANAQFMIPPTTWRQWCATAPNCAPVNDAYWRSIFSTIGQNTVYVRVDANGEIGSFGDIIEADDQTAGESDNLGGPYTVNVAEATRKLRLPILFGPPLGGSSVQPSNRMPWPHSIQ